MTIKRTAAILILLITMSTPAAAYNAEVDYSILMMEAVEAGDHDAGRACENLRNAKIDNLELDEEKTDFFESDMTLDEIEHELRKLLADSPYILTDSERTLVERAVMTEAGGECFEGMMMIAQCIMDAAVTYDKDIAAVIDDYQICTYKTGVSQDVKDAVIAVFDYGERVTDEMADVWYAPAVTYSSWHEAQTYVATIGGHKFFRMG